jgi:sulfoxide reductase heme-binding subunit YedZ
LHRLVYLVAILAVIHFFWIIKLATYNEPILYAVILAVLLLLRLPPVRQRIITWRKRPA